MLNCSNERSEDWRETKPNSLSVNGTAGGKTVLVADIILLCGLFQYILTMCCAWGSLMVWYTFDLKDISISAQILHPKPRVFSLGKLGVQAGEVKK